MSAASPRIVSLLPAATEIVAALGLTRALVGRSHDCDEPPDVRTLPALTAPRIDPTASSRGIHEQVERMQSGHSVGGANPLFALDVERLAALEPDLILTQGACAVCAIAANDVRAAVERSGTAARVLECAPASLAGLYAEIRAVAAATGTPARGRELVARLRARVASVACRVRACAAAPPPRVALIEWLDPPMAAGNWVPELVALAGGVDPLGRRGDRSHWIGWEDLAAVDPDVIVLVPCGFTVDRVVAEAGSDAIRRRLTPLRAFREGRIHAVDGHHLFNRPGPRLVDSLEVLAELLHPGLFAFPATARFVRPLAR